MLIVKNDLNELLVKSKFINFNDLDHVSEVTTINTLHQI